MSNHVGSLKTYFAVFLALLALTGVTVAVAHADFGSATPLIAVGIAGFKATLVMAFFMHLKQESKLVGLWAVSGFVFLAIMIALTMGEVAGRTPQSFDPLPQPNVTPAVRPPK